MMPPLLQYKYHFSIIIVGVALAWHYQSFWYDTRLKDTYPLKSGVWTRKSSRGDDAHEFVSPSHHLLPGYLDKPNVRIKKRVSNSGPGLTVAGVGPIRIAVSYASGLDSQLSISTYHALTRGVLPLTLLWWSNVISLPQVSGNFYVFPQCDPSNAACQETCNDLITIPSSHLNASLGIPNADMVLYVVVQPSATCIDTAVVGQTCRRDSNGRPVAATLGICDTQWKSPGMIAPFKVGQTNQAIAHSLGWSNSSFPYWRHADGTLRTSPVTTTFLERGMNVTKLTTPAALREARKFFACPTLNGVELENYSGRNWMTGAVFLEKRLFQTDFMTASTTPGQNVDYTAVSLAVFEDMGWYRVNYTMASRMAFGEGRGCDFALGPCVSGNKTVLLKVLDAPIVVPKQPWISYGAQDSDAPEYCLNPVVGAGICGVGRFGKAVCSLSIFTRNGTNSSSIPVSQQYYGFDGRNMAGEFTGTLATDPTILGGIDPYMDYCPISRLATLTYYPYPVTSDCRISDHFQDGFNLGDPTYMGESYGDFSRCFMGSLINVLEYEADSGRKLDVGSFQWPRCYRVVCHANNTYTVYINTTGLICSTGAVIDGSSVPSLGATGFQGNLNCAPVWEICPNACLNGCSGRGNCTNGICTCPPGNYGPDCGQSATEYQVPDTWVYQAIPYQSVSSQNKGSARIRLSWFACFSVIFSLLCFVIVSP